MSQIVLDSSAILAIVLGERGTQSLTPQLLRAAAASTVNIAEVQSKLVKAGHTRDSAWADALAWVSEIKEFSVSQARLTGDLIDLTRPYGLSLGDRACLALAIELNAPVYTADKIWANLRLGIPIHILR